MRGSPTLVLLIIVIILATALPGYAQAQEPQRLFPETGFTVKGAFLEFYEEASDPLLLFGYPISNEVQSTGKTVQYFQRARFELVNGAVQLTALGTELYEPGSPVAPLNTSSPTCRRFDATGYSVCYSFLRFYDANQGEAYFGDPISAMEVQDGRYVQYFENARLEWRPDAATGEVVGLTDLGYLYFNARNEKSQAPAESGNVVVAEPKLPVDPVKLRVHAFVKQALISPNSTQTVYVIVQDQSFKPVPGVMVSMTVYYPNGSQYDIRLPTTSVDGISSHSFQVPEMPVKEIVRVEVRVDSDSSDEGATTWFRSWW